MYDVELNREYKDISDEELNALRRNIVFFCNTPRGSLPQNRDYGLDATIIDEPIQILKMRASVDIVTGVRKFFGVQITEINVTADENGHAKVKIKI